MIPWLHSAKGMLQTTSYLLLDHIPFNFGILDFNEKWKVMCLAGLTILKKETCLCILSACGVDAVVALRLRNAADYRLPNFGPHGTKLGHSWFQWKMKSDLTGWFDNSEKVEVSGHCEWMWGWSCGCTPPQEYCRRPPTYFWVTWHQTRAFLNFSEKWKIDFLAGLTFWKKETCLGFVSRCGGDPLVSFNLRYAADYLLPTFGPHGTN